LEDNLHQHHEQVDTLFPLIGSKDLSQQCLHPQPPPGEDSIAQVAVALALNKTNRRHGSLAGRLARGQPTNNELPPKSAAQHNSFTLNNSLFSLF
jgi:hypothetical protein